jgi:hypothetical protein
LNKDSSPTTNARDDFSIDAPTLNILLFSSIESPNPAINPTTFIAHAWIVKLVPQTQLLQKALLY